MNYYLNVLKNYAVFTGRARRSEYWFFVLFNLIIAFVLGVVDGLLNLSIGKNTGVLGTIYSLAVFIPSIAVMVRRLHDTNRSGWWIFVGLIPIVGAIVLIIFAVQDSTPGENKYGQNPKSVSATTSSGSATVSEINTVTDTVTVEATVATIPEVKPEPIASAPEIRDSNNIQPLG
jgi:uncharacterized membrane protein YhaH (DUF805 family)